MSRLCLGYVSVMSRSSLGYVSVMSRSGASVGQKHTILTRGHFAARRAPFYSRFGTLPGEGRPDVSKSGAKVRKIFEIK